MKKSILRPEVSMIEEKLSSIESTKEKLVYLYGLRKELTKIIFTFNNTVLRKYTQENDNLDFRKASELAKFVEDLNEVREVEYREELNELISGLFEDVEKYFKNTNYYKKFYSKDLFEFNGKLEDIDDDLHFGVYDIGERIKSEIKKYSLCENFIISEIEYLEKQDTIKEDNVTKYDITDETKEVEIQRVKIKEYLLENYSDINSNINLNINEIAFEITDHYYPMISKQKRKMKKESIRQELMLFKSGKLLLD